MPSAICNNTPREILVHPLGWDDDSSPKTETFPVCSIGHVMFKVYILISEVFPLPPDADKESIVSSITSGLEFTLSKLPVLTGELNVSPETGRISVTRDRDSTLSLHVNYLEDEGQFPTYQELEALDVSDNTLSLENLPLFVFLNSCKKPIEVIIELKLTSM